MKKRLKSILILAVVLAVFALTAKIISKILYNANADKIVLRFAVTSRTNVYDDKNENLNNFVNKVYRYADASKAYKYVDAFIINGNVTGDGSIEAFEAFKKMSSEIVRPESRIFTTMGEQDFIIGESDEVSDPDIHNKIRDEVVNINNFSFIFMSPVYDSYESKYTWLDETLKSISDYNDKPVFVFQNAAIKDTYYGTQDWYSMESENLFSIFEQYPTVVDFSSSASTAANIFTSVFESNATYVNSGVMSQIRMKYEEYGNDIFEETISEYARSASQCRIVEVYGDGHIDIKTMNLIDGSIYKMPQSDEEMVFCIYPGEKEKYINGVGQKIYADKPVFAEETFSISSETDRSFDISFENAYDRDGMLFYNIKVFDNGNPVKECNTYADYINGTKIKEYHFEDLVINGELTILITPYDIYGISGEPFEYTQKNNLKIG